MHLVMKKSCLVLFIISFFCASAAFSEEVVINAEVMDINPELEFFIIDSGEDKDVELGNGLMVHRSGEKIAEAYIIEVRPAVSAAEILKIEEGKKIRKGDNVIIVKKAAARKWTPLLGPGRDELPQESSAISPGPMKIADIGYAPSVRPMKIADIGYAPSVRPMEISDIGYAPSVRPVEISDIGYAPSVRPMGIAFEINIDSKPEIVFSYAGVVLRENGYSVASSNRITGTLVATKPIELSLLKELWADSMAAIDHKVMAYFEIKPNSGSTKLKVAPYKEHTQKNKYIKRAVPPGSKYHKELANIAYIIKKRSEY